MAAALMLGITLAGLFIFRPVKDASQDLRAKANASSALDTAADSYTQALAADYYDQGALAADAAAAKVDLGETLSADQMNELVLKTPTGPTGDATALNLKNPDVVFEKSPETPSGGRNRASLSVDLVAPESPAEGEATKETYWRLSVAVNAEHNSGGTCWMVQRNLLAPAPQDTETYLMFHYETQDSQSGTAEDPDADQCTGSVAARLNVAALRALPENADSHEVDTNEGNKVVAGRRGNTWQKPLRVPLEAVTQAAS